MKRLLPALVLLIASSSPLLVFHTLAQTSSTAKGKSTTGKSTRNEPAKSTCTNNGTYTNSRGQVVKRPETCSSPPEGATAQCRDGTYSFSRNHRGTCSRHGGVSKWL